MAMNFLERIAYFLGRSQGFHKRGFEDIFSTSGARPDAGDPTAWIDQDFWGIGALAGGRPRTKRDFIREFQGWVYIATKLNAVSVASVPLRLYVAKETKGRKFKTISTRAVDKKRLNYMESNAGLSRYFRKSEEIEEVTDHAFLDLLQSVNPYQNKRDLMEMTSLFLDLTGEAYWFLMPDNLAVPEQIYVIPSQFINPKFGSSIDNLIEGYVYKSGSTEFVIKPEQIVYFNYPNPNNTFIGFSTIRGIAETIYIENEMDAFEAAVFENRARLGGVITQTEMINEQDKERLKRQFQDKHAGGRKAGKALWLPKGLKYDRDAMTPEEISFIEGRRIAMEIICLAFDVPPGALTSKDVNLANATVADQRHAKNGILPRCRRLEEKINEVLLPRYDDRLFCAYDNPVPEDRDFLLRQNKEYVTAGVLSRDEIRSELGKDGRGGLADELLVDSRLQPLEGGVFGPQAGPTGPGGERDLDELVRKAKAEVRRMMGA